MLTHVNIELIIIQTTAHVTDLTRAVLRIIYAILKREWIPKKNFSSRGSVTEGTHDIQCGLLTASGEVTLWSGADKETKGRSMKIWGSKRSISGEIKGWRGLVVLGESNMAQDNGNWGVDVLRESNRAQGNGNCGVVVLGESKRAQWNGNCGVVVLGEL